MQASIYFKNLVGGKKTLWCILMAFPCATIMKFIQLYIWSDWSFLVSLGVLVIVDSLLGVANAWKKHSLSSKGFGQIITKLFVYSAVLITTHIITHFTIDGEHPMMLNFIHSVVMSSLIVRETLSIFENVSLIYPGIIPAWILKRLSAFDEQGEPLDKIKSDTDESK